MHNSVLITGGTGYFGKAMTRRLLKDGVERICILSRDEYKQAIMRQEFKDDPRLRFFIGDVRDLTRLKRAMNGVEMVYHAAALKRIEVGYYNPDEMVSTNIIGTQNVIDAALSKNSKAVLLSTDKAFQPCSAYGYSKAVAESLFLAAGPNFSVTRYGNVSGSTGSVIPKWRALLCAGHETVPVTDPDATRFWMTEQEAVQLVLDTAESMPRDVAIPVLPAYRVGDLAEAMGAKMSIIGLPKWEKKHESMSEGNSSDIARRMSVEELMEALRNV